MRTVGGKHVTRDLAKPNPIGWAKIGPSQGHPPPNPLVVEFGLPLVCGFDQVGEWVQFEFNFRVTDQDGFTSLLSRE